VGGALHRASRRLADDEQRGERQREREQREGHRLRANRPLGGGRLRRLVGDEDLLAGPRVALRKLLRGRGEGRDGGARLQLHVRAVEPHVARTELAGQRQAAHDLRHLVEVVDGDHRTAAHEHADDVLGEQAGVVRAVHRPHPQHGADVQAQLLCADLIDGYLTRSILAGQAAGQHLGDVHRAAVAAVKWGGHDSTVVRDAPGGHRDRVDARDRGGGGDAWQRADRHVVGEVAGVDGRDEHIRGVGLREEPRVGGVGPARARRGGQHGATGDGDDDREACPAAPAGAHLVRDEQRHSEHTRSVGAIHSAR
jgi:hypothetical protein